ncbi:GntR family transcriptional regulator [Anaerobacillus alkaliphilus]|uniref:GntR family transcriptional regulator n=1 Tax=Anaerobacillus alkaliphilus TaxID=1548597 RepID=A0A4Q0VRY2_9BACI|nr:GntR family transcriptional regulator [Anaerobacillus alkaliphilus]RXI98687.1 GntR family transcriptional regulator [Anaerobacillus alkaliphilus]
MNLNTDGAKPIYIQIAEWIETEILNGNIGIGEKVYSQYQLAEMFNINPATAAKGLTILADENIVFKKRGLGMFVTEPANAIIRSKRKELMLNHLVIDLVREAERLQVSQIELFEMIKVAMSKIEGEKQ